MTGRTLLILGHVVKGLRSTLCINIVGTIQTAVLVQSLSNFICNLLTTRGETLLVLSHRVKGQEQLCDSACEMAQCRLHVFA